MYPEANSLNSVAQFHKTFRHPILNNPEIPSMKRANLRIALLEEELKELKEGIQNKNIVEVADALCDLQYVLSGAILEFGLANKFKELFDEVQRSNMSKACSTEQEAMDTVNKFNKEGITCNYRKRGNLFIVYRQDDNKVMKSINYSRANLNQILDSTLP